MNRINPLRYFYFHLLLLQLEEYDLKRFLIAIKNTRGIPPDRPFRKPLKLTPKIILIMFLSLSMMFGIFFLLNISAFILAFIVEPFFSFIFIFASMILLLPFDFIIKNLIIYLAKYKLKKLKNLKVIGIAGSYGKTGMKDIVTTILSEKFRVIKTPNSVNTPLGISQVVLTKIGPETEIFVVEMGEYYKKDVENICKLIKPDIGIITGINEAHFERLKSIDITIDTIFELSQFMKPDGILILNDKDKNIKNNFKKFIGKQTVYFYKNKEKINFNENLPGYIYKNIPLKILGEFNFDKIDAALFLAKNFGLLQREIDSGLRKIKTPNHRLQPFLNLQNNLLIIDDSYNGNPDGVEEAIKTLSLFKKRRKIFITPGLVEVGNKSNVVHRRIGKRLNDVVDIVILVKNSITPYIADSLEQSGFKKENILWFSSMFEVQKNLLDIVKSGDVVLFQNDWPDNYV